MTNPRARTCDVWNASSSTHPSSTLMTKRPHRLLVIRDRDREVEHDQEREQQPVAVAAGEALGVVLAVEAGVVARRAIRASVDARARR